MYSSHGPVRQVALPIRCLAVQLSPRLDSDDVVSTSFPLLRIRFSELRLTGTGDDRATEFSRSQTARDSDFSTNSTERGTFLLEERHSNPAAIVDEFDHAPEPRGTHSRGKRERRVKGRLIIQFAANDPVHLADAAELASPFVDAIDLNCGCPQKWAYQEGIGCALLRKPELVADLVRTTKQRLGWNYAVCVKIRVDSDQS